MSSTIYLFNTYHLVESTLSLYNNSSTTSTPSHFLLYVAATSQNIPNMAERDRPQPHQIQVHTQSQFGKTHPLQRQGQGPSATKVLTVMSLLPIGGTLLTLAGLTFAGTLTGLAVCTPLFILFSPVLVPAAIVIGLAVTGILASGACGLTGISSLSWVLNYFRSGTMTEQVDQAKRRMQDMTSYVGQKTKETGQTIQNKAQEGQGGRT